VPAVYAFPVRPRSTACPRWEHLHYPSHYRNLLLRQHYLPAGFAPTFRTVGPATETSL
jgi:hypothetical protein